MCLSVQGISQCLGTAVALNGERIREQARKKMVSNKAFGREEIEARGPRRILSFDTLKVSLGELREGPPH